MNKIVFNLLTGTDQKNLKIENTTWIILAAVIAILVIALLIYIFVKRNKKRKNKVLKPISNEFIEQVLELFGGTENILDVTEDGNRIKFEVLDLKICKLDQLKSLSRSGVFVTNNHVKMMFDVDSKALKDQLKNLIDE